MIRVKRKKKPATRSRFAVERISEDFVEVLFWDNTSDLSVTLGLENEEVRTLVKSLQKTVRKRR